MCGPQIRLCLFTFWLIASKQLNSLTTIYSFSWLGCAEIPGSISGSGKVFMFVFVCLFFCFHFLSKNTLIVTKNCNSFCNVIFLGHLTHCKICDRLNVYKDTDLASLIWYFYFHVTTCLKYNYGYAVHVPLSVKIPFIFYNNPIR